MCIAAPGRVGEPHSLARDRLLDARPRVCRRLSGRRVDLVLRRLHDNPEIEAIEQRGRQSAAIARALRVTAPARVPASSARAGICAGNEEEVGGELDRAGRAAHAHDAFLERLAETFEHRRRKLGYLVEKQRAPMGEADLAGSHAGTATADERDRGRAVVRCAKGRLALEDLAVERARRRMHARDFQRLAPLEVRHDRRQPARQHRLADSWWTDEEHVVSTRGRDGQRAARRLDAAHVDKVERFVDEVDAVRGRGVIRNFGPRSLTLEARVEFAQRARDPHGHIRHQRSFGGVCGGHDDLLDAGSREFVDEREDAGHAAYAPVEAEFAEHRDVVERTSGQRAVRAYERDRHRELQPGTGLAHRCRREIHGDTGLRILEFGRQQRGAHSLT
jgi:hypothetical protein